MVKTVHKSLRAMNRKSGSGSLTFCRRVAIVATVGLDGIVVAMVTVLWLAEVKRGAEKRDFAGRESNSWQRVRRKQRLCEQ